MSATAQHRNVRLKEFDSQIEILRSLHLISTKEIDRLKPLVPQHDSFFIFPARPPEYDLRLLAERMSLTLPLDQSRIRNRNPSLLETAHILPAISEGAYKSPRETTPDELWKCMQDKGRTPYTLWHFYIHTLYRPNILARLSTIVLAGEVYSNSYAVTVKRNEDTTFSILSVPTIDPKWPVPSGGRPCGLVNPA